MTLDKDVPPTVKNPTAPFPEPIPADLPRRQIDRKLLENIDADHDRIRAISSRLTRIEVVFETIQKDLARVEQRQSEMLGHTEQAAQAMSAVANKLNIHTELEEYQWTVVNKSNDTLATVTAALGEHLQKAAAIDTRIDWMERLLFLLYGGVGAILLAIAGTLLTQYLGK